MSHSKDQPKSAIVEQTNSNKNQLSKWIKCSFIRKNFIPGIVNPADYQRLVTTWSVENQLLSLYLHNIFAQHTLNTLSLTTIVTHTSHQRSFFWQQMETITEIRNWLKWIELYLLFKKDDSCSMLPVHL